jgi:hypothetical protein
LGQGLPDDIGVVGARLNGDRVALAELHLKIKSVETLDLIIKNRLLCVIFSLLFQFSLICVRQKIQNVSAMSQQITDQLASDFHRKLKVSLMHKMCGTKLVLKKIKNEYLY